VADQEPVTNAILELLGVAELSYLLAVLGALGVVCWLAAPGLPAIGAAGAALFAAGNVGLAMAPASTGAFLLLWLGAASLAMEVLNLPGIGLHAVGGGISFALAGLFLHGPWSGAPAGIVVPIAVYATCVTYAIGRQSWQDPL
jgi:membrane-bound ClpP family serine protease